MVKNTLRERCNINTNLNEDTFVGIKSTEDSINVSFPLGFRLSEDEHGLRRDILLLLNVLSNNTEMRESHLNISAEDVSLTTPIFAFLYVVDDYYSRGIYKETETINKKASQGRINWSRTIKTQKPYISEESIFFLDFITRKRNIKENEMITLIHEYCVYQSFEKIGWLFTSYMPPKPSIKPNKRAFTRVIKKKIAETFNDRNRQLFRNMLAIVEGLGDDESPDYRYGTNRFEYIWESIIDKAYGISNKTDYYPLTKWIINGDAYDNRYLRPDTIMLIGDKFYVIDAKYYKYGWTRLPGDLPDSESINKQITYGEYLAESDKFINSNGDHPEVFNAFIMPYDAWGDAFHTGESLYHIGNAISDWKSSDGTKPYEDVVGLLLDVKTIMKDYTHDDKRIEVLAKKIMDSVQKSAKE